MAKPSNHTGTDQPKLPPFRRSRWFVYGFAAGVTALTLLARVYLSPWIGDQPFLVVFFIPIIFSAYLGGFGPGLVATAIATLGADYLVLPPIHSIFSFDKFVDLGNWLVLLFGGIITSLLTEALHRARLRADANQRLLAVTLTSIGDAVITTDVQGCVTFLNGEAERLTGWTNAAAAGQPLPTVFRIVNEETRETVEDPVKKVFRTGAVVGLANHTVLIARDGREFIIDDSGAPIRQADGSIIGVVLVFRDNTEKKRAEAVLLRNKRFLQQTGHIAQVGGWEFDPVTGQGEWGEEVARIHDLDPHTKPNKEMGFSFYHGAARGKIEAAVKAAIEHGTPYDLELEFVSAKGKHKWVRTICLPVVENGKVVRVCGAIQDITDRRQAQATLGETQALYHSLVDHMPVGIFRKDAAGRYVFVNSSFCELKDMTPDQFLGKTASELGLEDQALAAAGNRHHEQIMHTGKSIEVDEQYLRANGQTLYLHVVKSPVFDADGKIAGSQGIMLDVTEHRLAEAAKLDSEALYHSLVDQLPAGIFRKDAAGRYVFVNAWICQLKGIQPELMLGKTPRELTASAQPEGQPDYSNEGEVDHQTIMRTGRSIEVEEEYPVPNGPKRYLHVVKTPVFDANGTIIGSQGVLFDVTELKTTQERYHGEHALLRTLVDLAPDFIFIKDLESRYLVVNGALAKCYGQTPAAMLGRTDADFLPPELATNCRATELQVLAANSFCTIKGDVMFPDGQPRVVVTNMVAFRDQEGKVVGLVGIGHDITAQEAADQALRESEARLSTIFHSSPVGIVITRFSDGQVLEVNEAFARIHALTIPELLGRKSSDLELWSDPRQRERMLEILNTEGRCKDLEIKFRRKDGTDGDLLVSAEIIQLAGEKCMLGLAQDITQRKAIEQQLKQVAAIVESSEDAIVGKTLAGVITSWNHGAEIIFGYPAGEALGQPLLMLFPEDRKKEEAEILARIVRGESIEHFETERIRKDGKLIRISATISSLKDSRGKIVGASKIARDITRQHLLEEQLRQSQKMEAIGQLAGGVAHDFNNILAVIQMQTELAKIEGQCSPEQTECIDEIQVAASRAANLTRQLLLFSRRQRLQPRELDLSDSITGMTKMLRRLLGEDIQMQFKYAPQPLFIHADAGLMDQLLMNLTVNSRDAMPNGGQLIIETAAVEFDALAASQSAQARPGAFVRLSVSDTGCGIPPEILPRIFEPFFTTKDVGKGTGLGLATVFSIVQQHQGWISVYSAAGQGTTFHIYLPRLTQTSTRQTVAESILTSASGGDETILLVEDDAALRAAVRKALVQLGYHLLEAASGADALRVWQSHRADIQLLLTDLVMPGGMSGIQLGQRLRQENPKLKVIYTSGYSAEVAGKDFVLEAGVNFLPKPFPAQLLAQTVRACLTKDGTAPDQKFPRRQSPETGEPQI